MSIVTKITNILYFPKTGISSTSKILILSYKSTPVGRTRVNVIKAKTSWNAFFSRPTLLVVEAEHQVLVEQDQTDQTEHCGLIPRDCGVSSLGTRQLSLLPLCFLVHMPWRYVIVRMYPQMEWYTSVFSAGISKNVSFWSRREITTTDYNFARRLGALFWNHFQLGRSGCLVIRMLPTTPKVNTDYINFLPKTVDSWEQYRLSTDTFACVFPRCQNDCKFWREYLIRLKNSQTPSASDPVKFFQKLTTIISPWVVLNIAQCCVAVLHKLIENLVHKIPLYIYGNIHKTYSASVVKIIIYAESSPDLAYKSKNKTKKKKVQQHVPQKRPRGYLYKSKAAPGYNNVIRQTICWNQVYRMLRWSCAKLKGFLCPNKKTVYNMSIFVFANIFLFSVFCCYIWNRLSQLQICGGYIQL